MVITFIQASESKIIAKLVIQLAQKICTRTNTEHFDIDLKTTAKRCKELLSTEHCADKWNRAS